MKNKVALMLIMLIAALSAFSQESDSELDIIQSVFGIEKHLAVAEFLQLEDGASNEFWEVYEAYESERKALGKRRFDLINKYVEGYFEMWTLIKIIIIMFPLILNKSYDKLIVKYYKKVRKTNGEKTASQFYQIEHFF